MILRQKAFFAIAPCNPKSRGENSKNHKRSSKDDCSHASMKLISYSAFRYSLAQPGSAARAA